MFEPLSGNNFSASEEFMTEDLGPQGGLCGSVEKEDFGDRFQKGLGSNPPLALLIVGAIGQETTHTDPQFSSL